MAFVPFKFIFPKQKKSNKTHTATVHTLSKTNFLTKSPNYNVCSSHLNASQISTPKQLYNHIKKMTLNNALASALEIKRDRFIFTDKNSWLSKAIFDMKSQKNTLRLCILHQAWIWPYVCSSPQQPQLVRSCTNLSCHPE